MPHLRNILAGASAAAVSALLLAVPALAYIVGPGSFATVPATVTCQTPFTFSATFIQPGGAPFPAGVQINFSQTAGPAGINATFNPTSALTDANGKVSTQVTLPAGCPGQFTFTATDTSSGGTASATTTAIVGAGGFPNTSALPLPAPHAFNSTLLGVLVVAGALVAMAAGRLLIFRRSSR